ncbi:MAG: F0F1 ATP synthase subunit B [Actinomycetes bacterium]
MRTRAAIASGVLMLGLLVGSASAVGAAPTTSTINPTVKQTEIGKCVEEKAAKGLPAEDCVKATSPIVPDSTDLFYGGLAFIILLVIMWKFALPGIKKGMEGRTDRIRGDLDRADSAKVEAEELLAQYQAQVADSKAEATRIIEDARATADGLKAELHRRAEAEIAELKQRAAADIEASKAQAISDLRGEVATLAIGAAEAVVHKSLDRQTQVDLIENYINQVGSTN